MSENPGMFEVLREKCQVMQESFDSLEGLELTGDVLSPVKHLRLIESRRKDRESDKKLLRKIVEAVNAKSAI
jgi:serine palmitoyltransferase